MGILEIKECAIPGVMEYKKYCYREKCMAFMLKCITIRLLSSEDSSHSIWQGCMKLRDEVIHRQKCTKGWHKWANKDELYG